jgi:hypothetical protein
MTETRFPHASKLAALAIVLSGVFLGMLTMEFDHELRFTDSPKTNESITRAAAFAIAWLVFSVILRWSGTQRRRSIVIGLVLAVSWWAITMVVIAIDNISFV